LRWKENFTLADVILQVEQGGPPENKLWKIFAPSAGDIRSLSIEGMAPPNFCIIDDTDCGPPLGNHSEHASIAFCLRFSFLKMTLQEAAKTPEFQGLKSELRLLLSNREIYVLTS